MQFGDAYRSRLTTAHDAIDLIQDGDHILVPTAVGEPPTILAALADRATERRDVSLAQTLPLRPYGFNTPELREHVRYRPLFLGGTTRGGAHQGWIDYIPSHFSEMPELVRRGQLPCDVVVAMASPMDEHGFFAISLGTDYTMAGIALARAVILEVNPNVPYTFGECHVHVSQVTAIVESEDPLLELPHAPVGEVERAIGAYVADLIPDGATVQMGIGGIPNAVVEQLLDKQDLGVHTEMMGDGILTLIEAGVVTNVRKNVHRGKMLATFALGSAALYRFMDRNPALEMHPVDTTNDPYLAAQNHNLHSINSTIEIDLLGQCASETIGARPFSGTGGQADFVRAAVRSPGGKSFIVTPATAKGGEVSRIVPVLSAGAHVTTHKNETNYVVTEYGVAQLRGLSNRERAAALIGLAHPDHRDRLHEEAGKLGLA